MGTNLFEEFQQKKEKVRSLANAALDKGWLTQEDYTEIINKLDTDILTIGVIGQMKCGKSTFLNAFLFNDTVLPAATNPMTAALSVITYGEEKEIDAEFYSQDEWANLKMQAERQLDDGASDSEINMKQAAKEVYAKSHAIASEIPSLLGTTKKDQFENLIEYVGAGGKYVSITKSVTIHYPVEWLKGVEIVDTPGFNDPIVSRELRTQEFLSKADVVLMLLYAGRAFDSTDRDIVFEKVRKVGIGKILVGVNKYDLLIDRESEEQIVSNVEEEIKKACREPKYRDDFLIQEIMRGIKPILLSANMALMAKMPLNKVYNDPDLKFHFDESCKLFGNDKQDQQQMLKDSLIGNLENAVREVIEKSKADILIKKPINHIFQLANNKREELETSIKSDSNTLKELKTPDTELEDKLDNLKKAQKRIERRIERATVELGETYDEITDNGIENVKNTVFDAKDDCTRIAKSAERNEMKHKLDSRIARLKDLELPGVQKTWKRALNRAITSSCEDFANEVVDQLERYVDDCDGIIDTFCSAIGRGASSLIKNGANDEEMQFDRGFSDRTIDGFDIFASIVFPPITLELLNWRSKVYEEIDKCFKKINFAQIEDAAIARRPACVNLLHTEATSKLLGELVDTLTEALGSKEKKEELIMQKEESLVINKKNLSELEAQIMELKSIINM
ncbi:MAG: dynamin family protein [Bacteroidales bacterium]|nr:dynamin family protein [Candidatus Sodaliphilus limicaballi]